MYLKLKFVMILGKLGMFMISEELLDKYRRAGEIASKVREEMRRTIREDMAIIEICENAEKMIRRLGGKPAFPCNVSVNEITAHYTSPPEDERRIPQDSVVKIDIGVHVDGYIADTATTVCFNPEYEELTLTSREALKRAINIIQPGLSISRFGSEIQKITKSHGFKPISNLTGHQIGRYLIHAGKSLPNVSHLSISKIRLGEVYAVEPFVTVNGAAGRVINSPETYIFRFVKHKSLKKSESKRLLKYIEAKFRTLPFAERWLREYGPRTRYKTAFYELLLSKSIMAYPVFIEASGKPVAQFEHTVLVVDDGCIVLT